MFQVGQKVVCVDAAQRKGFQKVPAGLKIGGIYTVQWFGRRAFDPSPGILIDEIHLVMKCGRDITFAASRFRPLAERKTDIGIFTKILDDARHKAAAKVE